MVGATALIIVLSVFNGFDNILRMLHNSFDPDIKIVSSLGKTFVADDNLLSLMESNEYIDYFSLTLEENAMLKFGEKQMIATIKGVDNNYQKVTGIDSMIIRGEYKLYEYNVPLAISGQGIAYNLGLGFNYLAPVTVYIPSRTKEFKGNFQDAADNINSVSVYPSGSFSIQQEYDTRYFIMPLTEVKKLLEYEENVSAIEIKLKNPTNEKKAILSLQSQLGDSFRILDRNLQHEYAYKIMKSEKWAIFMILILILLIASFNIIGSLTMLIIDKKDDISILKSLGADNKTIRNIFFIEGLFISLSGAILGLLFGSIICWLQMEFGLIKLGRGGAFIIDSYPVLMQRIDFIYVFITVMIIGIFAAWYPVRYITKKFTNINNY